MSGRLMFFLGLALFLVFIVLGLAVACGLAVAGVPDDCEPADAAAPAPAVSPGGGGGGAEEPPPRLIPIYQGAANQAQAKLGPQGPSMLAGVNFHETSFGTNVATSGPYVGPMAIGSAYWDTYGADGNGDGKKDIMNEADAIYAAAKILKEHGAPGNWRNALAKYNAGPNNMAAGMGYANDVIQFAQRHHIPATGGGGAGGGGGGEDGNCDPTGGGGDFSGNCTATGIAYIAQPGASGLSRQFGAAGDAGAGKHQKSVELLGGTVQVHEKVAPCAEAVERERKAQGITYEAQPSKGGIGGYRSSDGQIGNASFHVYGAAIDINPETNPYCNGGEVVGNASYCDNPEIPMELVKIFRKYGFYWGGDYTSLKDYMHFEWHGEKP